MASARVSFFPATGAVTEIADSAISSFGTAVSITTDQASLEAIDASADQDTLKLAAVSPPHGYLHMLRAPSGFAASEYATSEGSEAYTTITIDLQSTTVGARAVAPICIKNVNPNQKINAAYRNNEYYSEERGLSLGFAEMASPHRSIQGQDLCGSDLGLVM